MKAGAATIPRPEHPRPQFERGDWLNLNGQWTFRFDFGKSGLDRKWHQSEGFEQEITVPFCPESKLSGVQHLDFIEMMWYHRKLTIPATWRGKRILLNFGGGGLRSGSVHRWRERGRPLGRLGLVHCGHH
jgi:hypothetical protein